MILRLFLPVEQVAEASFLVLGQQLAQSWPPHHQTTEDCCTAISLPPCALPPCASTEQHLAALGNFTPHALHVEGGSLVAHLQVTRLPAHCVSGHEWEVSSNQDETS